MDWRTDFIADLKRRVREYERRCEDSAIVLASLKGTLAIQKQLLAADIDRRLNKEHSVAADVTCADTASRMKKCFEDASGKNYKPMGEESAWHHKHPNQEKRELAAQLPLCDTDVATVASDEADVQEIVAGNRDCEACHGGPCPQNDDCPQSPDVYREPWHDVVDTCIKNFVESTNASDQKRDIPWQPLPEQPTDSRGVRYEGGKMVSKTGAVRSSDAQHERYDLIGTVGLRRLAETYAEGAKKYTDDNWLKGFPVSDILNHTFRHYVLYRAGDRSEDHLAHAVFGLFAAMHYEEHNPDCIDIKARLNPDGTVKQYRRWWENET